MSEKSIRYVLKISVYQCPFIRIGSILLNYELYAFYSLSVKYIKITINDNSCKFDALRYAWKTCYICIPIDLYKKKNNISHRLNIAQEI